MLRTDTQIASGQVREMSPLIQAGQCWKASLLVSGPARSRLFSSRPLIHHARTPPGSSTSTAGPWARIRDISS